MDDIHLGALLRAARLRLDWRQEDVAQKAGLSHQTVSRFECGQLGRTNLNTLRKVATVVQVQLDVIGRWRGGEGVRLLSSRHSALAESVARDFLAAGWEIRPEVSFAFYAERGVIDLLAWHPGRRILLVIELKTELVDIGEMLGTLDRKRRLAPQVAKGLGWEPAAIGIALIVAERAMNRRRLALHARTIRAALPGRGHRFRAWLQDPTGPIAAAVLWANSNEVGTIRDWAPTRRVRRRKSPGQGQRKATPERGRVSRTPGERPAPPDPALEGEGISDTARAVGTSPEPARGAGAEPGS